MEMLLAWRRWFALTVLVCSMSLPGWAQPPNPAASPERTTRRSLDDEPLDADGPDDQMLPPIEVRPPVESPTTFIEEGASIPRVGLFSESIFNSPQGLTIVDEQQLRERLPRTPAEALRYKPGIWVQKTGHRGGAPIIRGFMGNRVIYSFDGIRRNTASLFGGPNGFLQNIDALDVDRIEVIRGPGSVLYGSDAIGGVINVITNEEPVFTETTSTGYRTYGRWGSVDDEMSGRQEFFLSSANMFAFVGGSLRDISDVRGGSGIGIQDPSSWREENWDAQLDFLIDENRRLQFFFQEFNAPTSRRFDRPEQDRATHRELYGIRLFAYDLTFADQLEATAYYHSQLQDSFRNGVLDRDQADKTVGVDVKASTELSSDLRLVYGFHLHQDDVTQDNPRKGTTDPDVLWINPALYALGEFQMTDWLRLDAGVRWDQFTLKSFAPPLAQFPQEVQDAIALGELSIDDFNLNTTTNAVTGGVGAVVALTDSVNLVGHVGRAFRAPNKNDLLRFGQFTFGFNVPSPGVKPESSWTYEMGIHVSRPDFAAALTAFHTEVADAVVSTPGTFGGRTFIDANGNGVEDPDEGVFVKSNSTGVLLASGLEYESVYYLPHEYTYRIFGDHPLSLYGNFTWIIGKDTGTGDPLSRAFPANGLIGLRLESHRDRDARWWWISAEAWMVRSFDRIPATRLARDPAFKSDPQDRTSPPLRVEGYVPGFTIFNVRGGIYVTENATWVVAIENVGNRAYRVKDSRIDGPGFSFVTGLDLIY